MAASVVQDFSCRIANGHQAVDTDIHGQFEPFSTGFDRITAQVVSIGKCDRMQQEVDFAEVFGGGAHDFLDVFVILNVQRHQELGLIGLVCQQLYSSLIAFALVVRAIWQMRETAFATLLHNLLSDCPGDRVVIGHAQNQSLFAVEQSHGCHLPCLAFRPVFEANTGRRRSSILLQFGVLDRVDRCIVVLNAK